MNPIHALRSTRPHAVLRSCRAAAVARGHRVVAVPRRTVRWLLSDPRRVLTVLWLAGLMMVGTSRVAAADILDGPDLAGGAPRTLYETYDYTDYRLMVKPDEENTDWYGLSQGVLEIVGFINNFLLWICLGLTYGALALLSWFLHFTIYQDVSSEIDTATRMIANRVFWPLISATVAIGAFMAYARWRGQGRGVFGEMGWIVAATVLAMGFAAGPSAVMTQVDGLRQDVAAGVMTGASQYADTKGSPTGFPTPPIQGDQQVVGTRKLVDSMWSIYGATTWCRAMFRSLEVCQMTGHHALANDRQWQTWMDTLDAGGAPKEFGEHIHYMRGQDFARTAYLLVLAFMTVPLALLMLRLVIAGLTTVLGFLLLLVVGMVFLTGLPVRGPLRQSGVRYLALTLGMQAQGLLVTVLVSGTMVVSVVVSTRAATYGFLALAVFNVVLFATAVRVLGYFDWGLAMPTASGFAILMIARSVARATTGAIRTAKTAATRTVSGAWRAGRELIKPLPKRRLPDFSDKGNWRPLRFPEQKSASTAGLDTEPLQRQQRSVASGRRPIVYGLPSSGSKGPGPSGPNNPRGGGPAGPSRTRPSPRTGGGGGGSGLPQVVPGTVVETSATGSAATATSRTSSRSTGGSSSRVWVHKTGQGVSPVDPTTASKPSPKQASKTTPPPRHTSSGASGSASGTQPRGPWWKPRKRPPTP